MNRIHKFIILLAIGLFTCVSITAYSDDDDDDMPSRVFMVDGIPHIKLSLKQRTISGLQTEKLESVSYQNEFQAFANVVSAIDLIQQKNEYDILKADVVIARHNYDFTDLNYKKLLELNKTTANVQAAKLREAKAQKEMGFSAFKKQQLMLSAHKQQMIQLWGEEITEAALASDSKLYKDIVENRQSLLIMNMKPTLQLAKEIRQVYISQDTNRLNAREARIVSVSNRINSMPQGETYFLVSDTYNLRPGMRLFVWVPKDVSYKRGVVVPDQALVWHAGQVWAYSRVSEDMFYRKALINPIDTGEGWFVIQNFNADEEIVVQGAQMLLSEEYRGSIPDEDDDP